MIGTHNTFTYLPCDSKIVEGQSRFWRCQDMTIAEQYKFGVRYFDIRIFRTVKNGRTVWQAAHGMAELKKTWMNVKSICNMVKNTYKGSKFRLLLEKGDQDDIDEFAKQVNECVSKYPQLDWAIIKNGWIQVYMRDDHPKWNEYSYEEWNVDDVIKNLASYPIKENAIKKNPTITKHMIETEDEVWLMDFINH